MEELVKRVAGIDVHKKQVTVSLRLTGREGGKPRRETREFATTTGALLELGDYLEANEVELVVMEATGVYWKPLWNLFEGVRSFAMELVNPKAVKGVPGRKTDACDAQWLADLAAHGLVRPSFVPARTQRDLRDLTRLRESLVKTKAEFANRLQKMLEDANIKLGDVATDVLGVSGRKMLRAIAEGETDPAVLAEMAMRRLRAKLPELRAALAGRVTSHHRFLIGLELGLIEEIEQRIDRVETEIDQTLARLKSEQWEEQKAKAEGEGEDVPQSPVSLLCTIPGLSRTAAKSVIAETGVQMERFPTAAHLASWAGLCPGNNESAGKRRSGKMREGNAMLRGLLAECAWGASRKKNSPMKTLFWRIAKRRGQKRALMAVAHRLIQAVWWVLRHRRPWVEKSAAKEEATPEKLAKGYLTKLRKLGFEATLTPVPTPAPA